MCIVFGMSAGAGCWGTSANGEVLGRETASFSSPITRSWIRLRTKVRASATVDQAWLTHRAVFKGNPSLSLVPVSVERATYAHSDRQDQLLQNIWYLGLSCLIVGIRFARAKGKVSSISGFPFSSQCMMRNLDEDPFTFWTTP